MMETAFDFTLTSPEKYKSQNPLSDSNAYVLGVIKNSVLCEEMR